MSLSHLSPKGPSLTRQAAICGVSSGDSKPPTVSLAVAQTTCGMKAKVGIPLGTATCWVLEEGAGVPRQYEGL